MTKRLFLLCVIVSASAIMTGCAPDNATAPRIVGKAPHTAFIQPAVVIPKTNYVAPRHVDNNMPHPEWIPPRHLENKTRWKGIIIHHSATPYGSARHEDKIHKSKGWDGLGYHFVINNGVRKHGYGKSNGLVEVGYRWSQQKTGAHSRTNGDSNNYYNEHTIGICLIGNFEETRPTRQQRQSLLSLVRVLSERYNIPKSQIKGHKDIKPTKCPGKYFPMAQFKQTL